MSQGSKAPRRALLGLFVLVLALGCFIVLRRADHTTATQDPTPLAGEVALSDAMVEGQASSDETAAAAQAEDAAGEAADEGSASNVVADQDEPTYTVDPEAEADAGPQVEKARLTIPEGVDYEPDVVLFSVAEGATVEEVNAALAQTGSVAPREVTAEEVAYGLIELEVAEGASVEDAMNELDVLDVSEGAQPNFIYYALLGDEGDLRERLEDELTPQSDELPEVADTSDAATDDAEAASAAEAVDAAEDAAASDETQAETDVPQDEAAEAVDAAEGDASATSAEASDDAAEEDAQTGMQALEDALVTTNDTHLNAQWALASMHVYEAWALARCEHQVGIAIVDWGPEATHEDLAANVVDTYDAYADAEELSFSANHGSVVAGIASAVADNEKGIAGVSFNADLMLVNVMRSASNNSTGTSEIVRAYRYILEHKDEHNIRIINISIGGSRSTSVDNIVDDKLKAVIDEAYDAGIVTVAAAGNSNVTTVPYYEYPGDFANIVSVMNLAQDSESASGVTRSETSNYNVEGQTAKNISAPGTAIVSTYANNSYNNSLNGTSMASPQVAGILALEYAANPDLSVEEAVDCLYKGAYEAAVAEGGIYDANASLEENYRNYGWGEVNAYNAVKLAKGDTSSDVLPDVVPEAIPVVAPMPTISGATRIPVGATASYTVTDGSLAIKSGEGCARLDGTTLTGVKAGKVVLSVLDSNGEERTTHSVTVCATSGTWILASKLNTSYVVDIQGGSIYNGGNAIIYASNGKNNQVWLFEAQSDGTFLLRSGKTGRLLDVNGSSKYTGANVIQYGSSNKASQRWSMQVMADNSIIFVNKNSGMVLEVDSDVARNKKNVRQATRTGSTRQRWVLKSVTADIGPVWDGIYRVSSRINQNYVLEVYRASKAKNANVEIYRWKNGSNQRWQFTYLGKGVYKIINVNSGLSLDVSGGKQVYKANIIQWTWKNAGNQRWSLKEYSDGSYAIVRAGTTWVIDVYYGKAENCRNVQQYRQKDNSGQRWFLTQL